MFGIFRNNSTRLYFYLLQLACLSFLAPKFVSAALQNATVDDQNLSLLTYVPAGNWSHYPWTGVEQDFYNGSVSYTRMPTNYVSFTFTGSGIYLQGPYAPNQALRSVTLDGKLMGIYGADAPALSPSKVFWGMSGMTYATHTVVATHADTAGTLFAIDCFIVEYDPTLSPYPFSTTTTTVTASVPTLTAGTNTTLNHGGGGPNQGVDPGGISLTKGKRTYGAVIIAIVIPVLLVVGICIVTLCVCRNRRARSRKRRHESFGEKIFGRRRIPSGPIRLNSPISPLPRISSAETRPLSPQTDASTHYSTAMEHIDPTPASEVPPLRRAVSTSQNDIHAHALATANTNAFNTVSRISALGVGVPSKAPQRGSGAAFEPPAEWNTSLSSSPTGQNGGVTSDSDGHGSLATSAAAVTARTRFTGTTGTDSGGRSPHIREQRDPMAPPPSAWTRKSSTVADSNNLNRRPSTVFTNSDSDFSYHASPSQVVTGNQTGEGPPRRNSVFRRVSAALSAPFSRSTSRRRATIPIPTTEPSGRGRSNTTDAGTPNERPAESTTGHGGSGYFRGVNQFSLLGIPLNYRPVATAQSPVDAEFGVRMGPPRQSGSRMDRLDEGDESRSNTTRPPTRMSTMYDLGYTGMGVGYTQDSKPKKSLGVSTPSTSTRSSIADDKKAERILENFDGSTVNGDSGLDEDARSIGRGTLASQGTVNNPNENPEDPVDMENPENGLTRSGSPLPISRQRSVGSHADSQGSQAGHTSSNVPPPYTAMTNLDPESTRNVRAIRAIHEIQDDQHTQSS